MKRIANTLAACALIVASTQASSAITAFTPGTTGGPVYDATANVGMAFTVNDDIVVTALGAYDWGADGFVGTPVVGIFDASQTLLGSVTIPMGTSAALDSDRYRYASVSEFTLVAGKDYWLSLAPSASDPWMVSNSGTTTAAQITQLNRGRYTYSGLGLQFPDQANQAYDAYIGPNFQFRLPGGDTHSKGIPDGGSTLALAGLALSSIAVLKGYSSQRTPVGAASLT
ncbi:VPDSG-CTERM sorting domain-containing protein [bacterium]|nr:VPDSG-CTERM sorting domain-containing protein [bacterium]